MNLDSHDGDPIHVAASKIEVIEGLQRALDLKYRQLLKVARTDWERLFGSKDPSGAADRVTAQPGSGFLKPTGVAATKDPAKRDLPRFAQ